MAYSLVVRDVGNIVKDINSSLMRKGGVVLVICSQNCKEKLLGCVTEDRGSRLEVLAGLDTHQAVIERLCSSEISTCYIERRLATALPTMTHLYILSRLRNQKWCDNRITIFWEEEIK